MQDPGAMANSLLCHEVAHILAVTEARNSDIDIKQHGHEWSRWYASLLNETVYDYSHDTQIMDFRAAIIFGGGQFCICGCDPGETGKAISLRSKGKLVELKNNGILCEICGMSYTPVPDSKIPESVADDIEFLKKISLKRVSNNG